MSGPTLIVLIVAGGIAGIVGIKLLMMLLVSVKGDAGGLVLNATVGNENDEDDAFRSAPLQWDDLVGQKGVAMTDLRMAGKAKIDGKIHDVLSVSEYIERGDPIRVVGVEGVAIVVERD